MHLFLVVCVARTYCIRMQIRKIISFLWLDNCSFKLIDTNENISSTYTYSSDIRRLRRRKLHAVSIRTRKHLCSVNIGNYLCYIGISTVILNMR